MIAADGLHSVVRRLFTADQPVCSGFAAYRGTARIDQVTARSRLDWSPAAGRLQSGPAALLRLLLAPPR